MSTLPHKPALDPSTTTILVTGASGSIANHVVNEALKLGYTVRGTARTEEKAQSTHAIFGNNPKYSTVVISDYGSPVTSELDEAVRGVNAIIHVAGDTSFGFNADEIITKAVTGNLAFLEAAAREPNGSVKRFVLTSSSTSAAMPIPNKEITLTTETFNEEAIDVARNKPGEFIGPCFYGFVVYAASKTEGEKSVWSWAREKKPNFVVNAILPGFNSGRILKGGSEGVTSAFTINCVRKSERPPLPPQYYIDTIDDARLHLIAAVLDDSLENERIFAWAYPFNWNEAIDAIDKVRPDLKVGAQKDPNDGHDLSIAPNELGASLLKKWFGQDGYKSLEQSIKETLEHI